MISTRNSGIVGVCGDSASITLWSHFSDFQILGPFQTALSGRKHVIVSLFGDVSPGALGAWHALVPPALPVQGKYELRRAREVVGSVPSNEA